MGTHSQSNCHRVDRADEFFVQHGYTRVPQLVQWMATLRCGLSCEHCLAAGDKAGLADMSLERAETLVDEVADLGVPEFLLTGGEPLVREDLGEVVARLGHRQVNWTLNTAAFPDRELRAEISKHRPGFVAVSLDGPKAVHDGFRGKVGAYEEALESITFFKSLGIRVCAGTTVTRRNYTTLEETFHLVVGSGADQWGLHLLLPEGRAAQRQDLFLSRSQLKRLIKFAARKRSYFNVQIADEIGYLGLLEPLVRPVPLTCGAGRSQCVVLPDGSVVPCTTLDRSTSAGNIHEQSLQAIWSEGFAEQRSWRPTGKCGRCDYARACKGGCWLQRKAGTECFKDVWHVPGALKTAAGIAICLGGLAVTESLATAAESGRDSGVVVTSSESEDLLALDDGIMVYYYNARVVGKSLDINDLDGADWDEVGWAFFRDFVEGVLPEDLVGRCTRIHQALETEQSSLSLTALCWQVLTEPILDAASLPNYDEYDRQLLQDTLSAIQQKATHWRQEIFAASLDPFLTNGRYIESPTCFYGKGGVYFDVEGALIADLQQERWGRGSDYEGMNAAEYYVQTHPFGDRMNLTFTFFARGQVTRTNAQGTQEVTSHIDNLCTGSQTIGLFDVIEAQEDVILCFELKGTGVSSCSDHVPKILMEDAPREVALRGFPVYLEANRPYSYAEILNAIYSGQRDLLLQLACAWLTGDDLEMCDGEEYEEITIHENGALMWPAIREIIAQDSVTFAYDVCEENPEETTVNTTESRAIHEQAVLKDVDFWMF